MSDKKEPILIIDGDIPNFTIGRVTEDISDFGDQVCESFDKEAMVRQFEEALDKIGKKCGYSRKNTFYALSCEKNFRKRFFPTYKSNRKDIRKPLGLKWLREFQKENAEKYNIVLLEELEADDTMGILGTSGDPSISIHSEDKDLRTIPVRQWCFTKKKFWTPTYEESQHWLYTQVLTGDVCDGYKGAPKIGKVKAEKALRDCTNDLELLEQVFVRYYIAYDKDIDIAKEKSLEQFGQARILHQSDFMELKQNNKTFNPYEILGVSSIMLETWVDKHLESIAVAKKKPKIKKVKDV